MKITCLFHPDFDRWPRVFTGSACQANQRRQGRGLIGERGPCAQTHAGVTALSAERARASCVRFTASEEFHLALKQYAGDCSTERRRCEPLYPGGAKSHSPPPMHLRLDWPDCFVSFLALRFGFGLRTRPCPGCAFCSDPAPTPYSSLARFGFAPSRFDSWLWLRLLRRFGFSFLFGLPSGCRIRSGSGFDFDSGPGLARIANVNSG